MLCCLAGRIPGADLYLLGGCYKQLSHVWGVVAGIAGLLIMCSCCLLNSGCCTLSRALSPPTSPPLSRPADVQPGFPCAVIVDDRVDAWDCIAEHNVAQVSRWQYHCQQAVHELHPDGRSPKEANAAELSRMQGVIGSARLHFYASTGQVGKRAALCPSMGRGMYLRDYSTTNICCYVLPGALQVRGVG